MVDLREENALLVDQNSNNKILDPRGRYLRWIAMIFMCFLPFGAYYCDDNPAGLQDVMKEDLKISSSTFTSFYSWYSWPNVIMSAVGGVLIDKWLGVARGATVFCSIVVLGQLIFGFGGFFQLIWVMNMGRFVFGVGSESLSSAQSAYAVSWFFGKQLNFVFGLQLSFSRVASLINLNTIRPIYDSLDGHISGPKRIGITLLIAVSTCIFSLGCALILWWLDNRHRRVHYKDNPNDAADEFRLRDVRHFPVSLYCLYAICVFYYVAIFPFIALAQLLYESKYGLSPVWSNACNSLIYFMQVSLTVLASSVILSPMLGYVIDRTGRNIYWLLSSIIATIIAHGLLAFLFVHPVFPLVLMGIAYSILAASLWPLVAFLVPKQMLGTAYGLMQSIQNLGFAIINILTGLILDQYGYFMLEIFFIVCLEIALLAAAFLYVYNSLKKGLLNDSPAVRQAKEELLLKMSSSPQILINAITSTPVDPEDREKTRTTTNIQENLSSTC